VSLDASRAASADLLAGPVSDQREQVSSSDHVGLGRLGSAPGRERPGAA